MSTIRYHCDPHYKECARKRRNKSRKNSLSNFKLLFGGKCKICGYDRCQDALDFHHKNPEEKAENVSWLLNHNGFSAAKKEAEKCILICSNCHREVHAGIACVPLN